MTEPDKLKEIFLAVLAEKADSREKALDARCQNAPGLRKEIEALLQAHAYAGSYLDPVLPNLDRCTEFVAKSGDRVGAFELTKQIGEGAFGQVFHGQQESPVRRNVAIKLIRPEMASKEVLARFAAEQQVLAIMNHPNIASVIDAGTTANGQPFCVMELIDGVPVTRYCDQHHLSASERIDLLVTICGAIQHAHQKGIIHRDLKPGNILVSNSTGSHVPKIIDFGVAKSIDQTLTAAVDLTTASQLIGTPLYMSPEQASQSRDVDSRSDVYSIGVVMYELLTGSTPLEKESCKRTPFPEVCRMVCESNPPTPSKKLSDSGEAISEIAALRSTMPARLVSFVRGDLDWIVLKALEKDRDRRYQSPQELADDLKRFMNHEAVVARPPSVSYRTRKFIRKNLVLCSAAAVVAAILLGATFFSLHQARVANQAKLQAMLSSKREFNKRQVAESVKEILLDSFRKVHPDQSGTDADILENAFEKICQMPDEEHDAKLELLCAIADSADGLSLYDMGHRVGAEIVRLSTLVNGSTDPQTLYARVSCLDTGTKLRKHDFVLRESEQLVNILKDTSLNRELLLRVRRAQHMAYWKTGKWQKARACQQQMSDEAGTDREHLLSVSPSTFEIEREQINAAIQRNEAILEAQLNSGEPDLDTIDHALFLCQQYKNAGMNEKRMKLLAQLELDASGLGPKHAMAIFIRHELAKSLFDHDLEASNQKFAEIVAHCETHLGPTSEACLSNQFHVARTFMFLRKFAECEETIREVIKSRNQISGANHLATLNAEWVLHRCQMMQAEEFNTLESDTSLTRKSEEMFNRSVEHLGRHSTTTLMWLNAFMDMLEAQGQDARAISVLEEHLNSFPDSLKQGNSIFLVVAMRNRLAACYVPEKGIEAAIDLFEENFRLDTITNNPARAFNLMAFAYEVYSHGHYEYARQYALRGLELCRNRSLDWCRLKSLLGASTNCVALAVDNEAKKEALLNEAFDSLEEAAEGYLAIRNTGRKTGIRLGDKLENCVRELVDVSDKLGHVDVAEKWRSFLGELGEPDDDKAQVAASGSVEVSK